MFAQYFIVVSAKAGIIQTTQLFTDESRAVGYAQTMFEDGRGGIDDAVVFVVDPETGQGDEIFTVHMESPELNEDEEELDNEDDFIEDIPLLSSEFNLVDVEKLYGEAALPSKTKRESLEAGTVVLIECATMDTHEKCLVEVTKVVSGKKYKYEGKLISLPEHFELPPKQKVKFSEANILNII